MARYNTVSLFLTTSGTTTMTYAINNSFMTITGSSGITLTLVSPQYTVGYTQTFLNNTGGSITLATPAGQLQGNGIVSGLTTSMPAYTTYTINSDGTNYYIINKEGGPTSILGGLTSDTLTVTTTATISPSGVVNIKPTGAVTIAPTALGAICNVSIGSAQPSTGGFTNLTANSGVTFTGAITSTGTGSGTVVVTGGVGISGAMYASTAFDNGSRVITSVTVNPGTGISGGGTVTGPSGSVTLNNTGVLSLTGTTNRITVSGSTGNITLNLPQDIQSGASPVFGGSNFTSIPNGALVNSSVTVSAGTGLSGGGTVALGSSVTLTNAGVLSLTGTTNRISVSASTGNVTLTLPQDIQSGASPTFNGTNITSVPAGSLSGGTLNSGVTASSLTSLGTLTGMYSTGCVCVSSNFIAQGLMYTGNCFCSAGAGLINNLYSPNCFCVGGQSIMAGNVIVYGSMTVCGPFTSPPRGQALYEGTQPSQNGGTQSFSWTAPSGVNTVSVVAIGAGGGGYYGWAVCGGAGGGLTYSNNISVSPGSSYTLQLGNGGCWSQNSGGYSCFPGIIGGGGFCGCCTGCGCVGSSGGGPGTITFPNTAGGGGGGGGYGPNQCWYSNSGHTGCYGGGGSANSHHSSTYGTGGGGGTGIYGQGANGSCGRPDYSHTTGGGGGGGSGGTCGQPGEPWSNGQGHGYNCGGNYGGGGGGSGTSHGGGYGGRGAVRIVWPGNTRSFPTTDVGA